MKIFLVFLGWGNNFINYTICLKKVTFTRWKIEILSKRKNWPFFWGNIVNFPLNLCSHFVTGFFSRQKPWEISTIHQNQCVKNWQIAQKHNFDLHVQKLLFSILSIYVVVIYLSFTFFSPLLLNMKITRLPNFQI